MLRLISLRVSAAELRIIQDAARKRGLSVAGFVISAACKVAAQEFRRFASLDIDAEYRVPLGASREQKAFIRKKIKRASNFR
jgi:uncharacterized protein (DUF1778 family)